MFRSWRYKLREAEEAHKRGRAEVAAGIIGDEQLQQYRPGQQLAIKVATSLIDRARQHVAAGSTTAAWKSLDMAQTLGDESKSWWAAQQELVNRSLSDAEYFLAAGDFAEVHARIRELERREIADTRMAALSEAARRLAAFEHSCRAAKFADAEEQLASVESLLPHLSVTVERRQLCAERKRQCDDLTARLREAMTDKDWNLSLVLADELLDLTPDYRVAQDSRRRAWQNVGRVEPLAASDEAQQFAVSNDQPEKAATCTADVETEITNRSRQRFMMWVDGVGGFLVCLAAEVSIGQAVPDSRVDVPIQGDLSRRHAKIRRDGEEYILEPLAEVRVQGRVVHESILLADNDEVDFGGRVKVRFRKPHALSATACLDFVSRHRTHPWADGVLLMAESCVLGPNLHNHVVCRDWEDDVVLFRYDGELNCRAMEAIEIDGEICDGRGRITTTSRITGEDFAVTLEEV